MQATVSVRSLVALRVTQLRLIEDVIPDDVRDVIANGLDRFFDISSVLLNLWPDKLHDCVAPLLTSLQKQSRRHLINQAAECLDLALIVLSLYGCDSLL